MATKGNERILDHGAARAAGSSLTRDGTSNTVDGVTCTAGNIVLELTAGANAGPWVVQAANETWLRPEKWRDGSTIEQSGSFWTTGPEGTSNSNTTYTATAATLAITVGTTSVTMTASGSADTTGIIGSTGSTDNVLLTANGTGGVTAQANSGITASDQGDLANVRSLAFDAANASVIASGAATITQRETLIGGEIDAADTLVTMAGVAEGEFIIARPQDAAAEPITVQHGTGADNIALPAGQDFILADSNDLLLAHYNGTHFSGIPFTTRAISGVPGQYDSQWALFDDFNYQTIAETDTPWILNSGSGASDAAINAQAGGVIRLTSGGSNTNMATDGVQVICAVPVQIQNGGVSVECRLHINTAITNSVVNFGLTDDTSTVEMPATIGGGDAITTNAADAVVMCYDSAADTDQWFGIAVDSDTDDTGNATLGVAPTADTYQVLRIDFLDTGGAGIEFFVDGTRRLALSGDAGVSPNVNLYAIVAVDENSAAAQVVDVDYIKVVSNR